MIHSDAENYRPCTGINMYNHPDIKDGQMAAGPPPIPREAVDTLGAR